MRCILTLRCLRKAEDEARMFGENVFRFHCAERVNLTFLNFPLLVNSAPVSKLSILVYQTKQDLNEAEFKFTVVGHVGDGACPPPL